MIFTDIADWVGPTPNRNPGGMTAHMGLVLHIQQGNEAGSIAWGKNPDSNISFHFGGPKTGRLQQLVDTDDRAWAQAAGNPQWISLENEGDSGDYLNQNQISNAGLLLAHLHATYGVPLQISDSPGIPGLGYHAMGGADWGAHPDCPGTPIIGQRDQIIAAAQGHIGVGVPYPGFMLADGMGFPDQAQGAAVRTMQQRLIARGYGCGPWGADGIFGRATAAAVGAFQTANPACQSLKSNDQPDMIVGPDTWRVLFS